MVTIFIDNKPYHVQEGQNLLRACLSLGFDLPYFCWHPVMHSVGACRQCAVKQFKDENDIRGRIVMSCMTPVTEGMRLSVDDPEARAFRSSIIEWLMLNHPHDCPVCDEGGECHLQDMTVMTGHSYRRTRFKKRTHRNQNMGPFINHEMNRCIQCYRCIRFYRDYAGGRDLDVFACHDHVYFGRHEDGVLDSEFSGNLVEVCPTGVFTDKTLKRHYTRKWDLQTAPSVCIHCGLGCNTIPGERYGSLRRILNRYNHKVNGYFLCDRGRFGYEFVNSGHRIRKALLKGVDQAQQEPVRKEAAINHVLNILSKGKSVIGIGSPRASLESNFVLRKFVGPENFYSGMSKQQSLLLSRIIEILTKGPARTPSLHDVAMSDAVLVLGEDVTNTAPMLALALRQSARRKSLEIAEKLKIHEWDDKAVRNAAQDDKSPIFIASVVSTKLDDIATNSYHAAPDDIARLGFSIAHELDHHAPVVAGISDDIVSLAKEIVQAFKRAKRPLIISGTSLGSETVIHAAANIAWALCEGGHPTELCYTVPECNSIGVGLMDGKDLDGAFDAALKGQVETVIILENDLYRRAEDKKVDDFLSCAGDVIVIDHLLNPTSTKADVVLPAGTFAESDGTVVNIEGRAQRFYQVFSPDLDIQESWKWIRDIITASGRKEAETLNLDEITKDITSTLPIFKPIQDIAPPANFRIAGMKIPRQPHRYSGRTAMLANINVHEPMPPEDPDSPLSFSMEGYEGQPPSPFIARYWSPGWNSAQALNKFQQEVAGSLRGGDPGKRLIEPAAGKASYFDNIPEAFKSEDDAWLVVLLYHIFGSEELSVLSPSIAERKPKPYLGLNPDDAKRIQVHDGETVELLLGALRHQLKVSVLSGLPVGVAGLGAGLSDVLGPVHPVTGNIRKK
jgi:NADH-quinone oxidoreductase subunit G